MQIEQLQTEIETLSDEVCAHLRHWFVEKDWEHWDQQIETDAASGTLDVLLVEAAHPKNATRASLAATKS